MNQLEMFRQESRYVPVPLAQRLDEQIPGVELGRRRIQEIIDKGKTRASRVIAHVHNNQPVDRVVKGSAINFDVGDDGHLAFGLTGVRGDMRLHRNALGQLLRHAHMPIKFAEFLEAQGTPENPWGAEHVAGILTDIYQQNHRDSKFLTREVKGSVLGVMSNHYKRLNTPVIIDSFASACQKVGAVPYEGYVSDTKIAIQAVLPQIYEPIPGEIMAFGVSMEHSDYGNGALDFLFFILRLFCLNGMIGQQGLRRIHKGKQLEENIEWSQKTYELDSATTASAIHDLILNHLTTDRVEASMEVIQRAAADKLDDARRLQITEILKSGLSLKEIERVNAKFNEPDVELLPPGNSMWRMANTVSWLAGQEDDEERKIDLQHLAGELLFKAA